MPVDMSRIPAQTQQALAAQRGATNAQDMTAVLEMLAQDPQSLSAALAQLGIQVAPEQLQQVAEDWVDQAAEGASGEAGEPTSEGQASSQAAEGGEGDEADATSQQQGATPPSAPKAPQAASSANDSEADDGTTEELSARSSARSATPATRPVNPNTSGGTMARQVGSAAPPMDDIISAAMMQQVAGNPEARVPAAAAFRGAPRPALPHSPSAVASSDPRMSNMIANIYRSVSGATAGAERAGAPTGPRGSRGGASGRPRKPQYNRNQNA